MKQVTSNVLTLAGVSGIVVSVYQIEPWALMALGGVVALAVASALGKE